MDAFSVTQGAENVGDVNLESRIRMKPQIIGSCHPPVAVHVRWECFRPVAKHGERRSSTVHVNTALRTRLLKLCSNRSSCSNAAPSTMFSSEGDDFDDDQDAPSAQASTGPGFRGRQLRVKATAGETAVPPPLPLRSNGLVPMPPPAPVPPTAAGAPTDRYASRLTRARSANRLALAKTCELAPVASAPAAAAAAGSTGSTSDDASSAPSMNRTLWRPPQRTPMNVRAGTSPPPAPIRSARA